MPSYSFDVVSEYDRQELVNVIDQVRRELSQRYDLKDSNSELKLDEAELIILTSSDITLNSIQDIIRQKSSKRNLSLKIFDFQDPQSSSGNRLRQVVLFRKGLNQELAKSISKLIRDNIKKVNVSIQGESLRVTSKSKDDLQQVISLLKDHEDEIESPLQYQNYR